jgi:hypothetical protein
MEPAEYDENASITGCAPNEKSEREHGGETETSSAPITHRSSLSATLAKLLRDSQI